MPKTIRLTSTYDGFKPGSIITVDDAVAAQLLAGGVNASADLAGGKAAYKQVQQSSMVPLPSGPASGSLGANETTEITLPPNFFLTVSGSAGAEGSAEVIDSTGSVSTPVQLRTAAVTFGSYQDERKVRLYANVGRFSYSSTPFGGVRLSPDSSGNVGIVGLDGKVIAIGGGAAMCVPRVLMLGDSFAEYERFALSASTNANSRAAMDAGVWHWALAMVGYHRLAIAQYAGVGGNTAAMMRARYAADVAAYDYDIMLGNCGVNDFYGYDRAVAEVLDDVKSMISASLAAGKTVVWATCPTQAITRSLWTLAKQKKVLQYNRELIAWATGKRNLRVVDLARPLMNMSDTTNAAPRAGVMHTGDGIHLHGNGSYLFGRAAYDVLNPLFPALARQFTPLDGLNDGWSGSILGTGVGAMAGTTGTAGTGVTAGGNGIPTGWTVQRGTGSTTGVAKKVADSGGDWLELEITGNGGTTIEQFDIRTASFHSQFAAGDTFSVAAEVQIDASGGLEVGRFFLRGYAWDGSVSTNILVSDWNRPAAGDVPYGIDRVEALSLRTPTITFPYNPTTAQVFCSIGIRGSGTAKVRIRNVHALKNV